ncbi:MAG: ABC transporter permease [Alphaproteobacteria bacterium]|nr:ABC transporter permease [Alphaproteobacteria bacterium]
MRHLPLAPLLVFYGCFLLAPGLALAVLSLRPFSPTLVVGEGWTGANYLTALADPFYLGLLAGTIFLGVAVTLVTLLLGYPLALATVRAGPRLKSFLLVVALSPLLINLVVRSYAWIVLLGDHGLINAWLRAMSLPAVPLDANMAAVGIGLAHVTLPLMVLSLVAVMERIDPRLLEAAASLGAGEWRILARVHVHLAMPGIATGSLLVFCTAISAFITPRLLGGNRISTISTVIYEKFTFSLNWPLGAALAMVLLGLTLVVTALHDRLFRAR